jgi:hypothetical protein
LLASVLGACDGAGEFVIEEHPDDPLPASWFDPDGYGWLDVATGQEVGEAEEPRCQVRAQFAVAETDGESERTMWKDQCALYPDLEMETEAGLRPAGGGVVVFGLGPFDRNVTAPPEWNPPVDLDCATELGGSLVTARSADAEDAGDEAPEFALEAERPAAVAIDAPVAEDFPTARFEPEGPLEVRWSGEGLPGSGVEILLEARAGADDGDGIVRCWTPDDGGHRIDASLVDLFRDQPSTVTVSRVNVVTAEDLETDAGWHVRLAWRESTSRFVLNSPE